MAEKSKDPALAALSRVAATDYITPKCVANGPLPSPSEERRAQSQQETAFDISASLDLHNSKTVLYLAYGSNLSAKTFKGVRGIRPISQINVVVPEIYLTFDLPGYAYVEPCFANVRFRKKQSALSEQNPLLKAQSTRWKKGLVGVVYEVSREDYATIIKTEGGGASYLDVVVDCFPLLDSRVVPDRPTTRSFKAHTLFSPDDPDKPAWQQRYHRPDPDYAQASVRYMNLLTDGAKEHKLPDEYREYLLAVKAFRITQIRQRAGRFLFLLLWQPLFMAIFGLARIFADERGRIPPWLAALTGVLFRCCWLSYDVFFKRIFGDGERTIENRPDENRSHSESFFVDF